jgi:O-antigen/teichoic acid export membrane protein
MALGKRNYQSFYPALQRMFVQKDHATLRRKFSSVGMITVATGLGIAALILAMNRTAVELLAKPDFYAGTIATSWFAVAAITNPLSGFFQIPLLVAGKMGKSTLVGVIRLVLAVVLCLLAYQKFDLPGLAAVVALLPLVSAAYGCWRGAKECGFKVLEVAGPTLIWAGGAIVASVVGGWLISTMPSSSWVIVVSHKKVRLPGWSEGLVAGPLAIAAVLMFVHAVRSFRKSEPAPVSSPMVDLA